MLHCPVCRTPLTELLAEGTQVSLPVCERCGGTWLDTVRSQRVVRGLVTEVEAALSARAAATAGSPPADPSREAAPRPEETRLCADCGAPMAKTIIREVGIVLDACQHGTWFDARELGVVTQQFALKAAADDADADEYGRVVRRDRRADAASGVGMAARIFGRLLR